MSRPFQCFALRAVLFLESVDGNDVQRAILRQLTYPSDIRGVAVEAVQQINYLSDAFFTFR